MKFSLLLAIVATAQALKLRNLDEPKKEAEEEEKPPKPVAWLKDTLPACPDDKNRTIMDDGKTHIVKYPYVGAVCQLQIGDTGLVQIRDLDTYDAINLNEAAQTRN